MKLIKIQANGNAGLQSGHFYLSIGVSLETRRLLKSGEVIEIPYDSNASLRGVDFIGDPYEQKEEVVEPIEVKTEESKKSRKKKE